MTPKIHKYKSFYFFNCFKRYPITACFSDRKYNFGFVNNTKKSLRKNRRRIAALGIKPEDLVCTQQPHGKVVLRVRENDKGKGAVSFKYAFKTADALITNEKDIPLAVFTADCLSLFIYDPKKRAIGIVHAGWRGTYKEIAYFAIKKMKKEFASDPKNLIVGLGPAIRRCCFQVDNSFRRYFGRNFIKRGKRFFVDIVELNIRQLLKSGVKKNKIFDSGICTVCQLNEFFSFRVEGKKAGRMISVIMLKGKE